MMRNPKETMMLDLPTANYLSLNGELRVVDTVLGYALGYSRGRYIRRLIRRNERYLCRFGSLTYSGRYLLNHQQAIFTIQRCRMPAADHAIVHIVRVFTAWQQGRLKAQAGRLIAADYEMAVELEGSREK